MSVLHSEIKKLKELLIMYSAQLYVIATLYWFCFHIGFFVIITIMKHLI